MTAEVAILNKTAVALAADSAVTYTHGDEGGQSPKIFNTAKKLFALSKYHPVGIMVYGAAEIMDVPWETVIKIYRKRLGKEKYETLQEYASNFISFFCQRNSLFPPKAQEACFRGNVGSYFRFIRNEINKRVQGRIDSTNRISVSDISTIVGETIKRHLADWRKCKDLAGLPAGHRAAVLRKYLKVLSTLVADNFERLPLSARHRAMLRQIAGQIFVKDRFPSVVSGIVVAGFGESDYFPSIVAFDVQGIVNNRLKHAQRIDSTISRETIAWIIPFAQREMVGSFLHGIHPDFAEWLDGNMANLFTIQLPETIASAVFPDDEVGAEKLTRKLRGACTGVLSNFRGEMKKRIREKHTDPVAQAVSFLPLDELASMAEALVNLTSFKRRISLDAETVGGPVDVAVISKGDGFVWIKRKHYFPAELNPTFVHRYMAQD